MAKVPNLEQRKLLWHILIKTLTKLNTLAFCTSPRGDSVSAMLLALWAHLHSLNGFRYILDLETICLVFTGPIATT